MPTLQEERTNTPNRPYHDVPFLPLENSEQTTRHGAQFFSNVKQLGVGFGSKVFRVDRDGMWAGAEDFASAPWKVDWDGNMTATSITISGYVPTGGSLADIGAGNITSTYLGSNSVIAGKIAANAVVASNINVANLSAIDADLGTITAGSITGITITGGTIRTSASGARVELDDTDDDISIYDSGGLRARGYDQGWEYYNPSGTLVGEIYASATYGILLAADLVNGNDIFYGVGSTGAHSFHVGTSGTTSRFFFDDDNMWLGDSSDYTYDIQIFGVLGINNGIDMDDDLDWGINSGDLLLYDGIIHVANGFVRLAQMSGTEADARSDDLVDGNMYYRTDDDVIRVRLNGSWKTITTS
jgi:hypothetical protein